MEFKKEIIRLIILTGILGSLLYIGGDKIAYYSKEEEQVLLEEAIKRAVVQCYAIEGMYPPDVAYIKKMYGVGIDEGKYIVHYEAFASNIMPDIKVIRKTWED